jgi:hypothetical protein
MDPRNPATWIIVFVVVSAIATTVLLRRRRIPVISLFEAENSDWKMARRVVFTFAFFCALAQAMAALPFIHGKFQWRGAPVLLWAIGLIYVYFWVRCIALLRRKRET